MTSETQRPTGPARIALLLAVGWLLAGALFKLLAGAPSDLPETIQRFPVLKPAWTFRLAIGLELAIAAIALIRPRVGWILIVLLFALFDFLLYKLVMAGESSCGCFGSNAPEWLTPIVMMSIDTVLMLAVLVTLPWSRFRGSKNIKPLLPVAAILIGLPWLPLPFFLTEGKVEIKTIGDKPVAVDENIDKTDFYQFKPMSWEGKVFAEVDLIAYLENVEDPYSAFPLGQPAHVILYRDSCEHCKEHFIKLYSEPLPEGTQIVLINIPELGDATNVVDEVKPEAYADFKLVPLPRGYGIQTPVAFDIDVDLMEIRNVWQGGEDE